MRNKKNIKETVLLFNYLFILKIKFFNNFNLKFAFLFLKLKEKKREFLLKKKNKQTKTLFVCI